MKEIINEMRATLAELKTQVGRDMPQFDRLEANLDALEGPTAPKAASKAEAVKAPSTAAPTTATPAESPESPFARVLGKQKEG